MATNKVKCEECGWKGTTNEILVAKNPFCENDEINGCPSCLTPMSIVYACEHEDCWSDVTCGTTTEKGYMQTCSKHYPRK